MRVAIKIYEIVSDGDKLRDVVVNNRFVIPFAELSVEQIVRCLTEGGVDGWAKTKLSGPGVFPHKVTNLVYRGDIEVA